MTDFITDEMVEAALTADMEERAGVDWREVLDAHEQEFEKRVTRAALVAAMRAAWRPVSEAPHGEAVFLGWWQDDGIGGCNWETEVRAYSFGWRSGSISNMSRHSYATYFQPLPPPPAKEGA